MCPTATSSSPSKMHPSRRRAITGRIRVSSVPRGPAPIQGRSHAPPGGAALVPADSSAGRSHFLENRSARSAGLRYGITFDCTTLARRRAGRGYACGLSGPWRFRSRDCPSLGAPFMIPPNIDRSHILDSAEKPSLKHWRALDVDQRAALVRLNAVLIKEGCPFGYRVANEIARFIQLGGEQSAGGRGRPGRGVRSRDSFEDPPEAEREPAGAPVNAPGSGELLQGRGPHSVRREGRAYAESAW